MNTVIEKWDEILQTVKSEYEVNDVPFNTWLKPLKVYGVDGKLITVLITSVNVTKYLFRLQSVCSQVWKNARFASSLKKISPKKQKKTLPMINRFTIHVTKKLI